MADLIQVEDRRLTKVLSYPFFSEEKYLSTVEELKAMSVDSVVSTGSLELGGIHVLGKGCVGVVLAASANGRMVALKILRSDANRCDLLNETRCLTIANGCGAGPKLVALAKRAFAMDLIDGGYFVDWLKKPRTRGELEDSVKEILRQCFDLDSVGLDHGELSDAKKHILVDARGSPVLIDFETASTRRKARNLVAILGYLFFKEPAASLIRGYLRPQATFLESLRNYKRAPSRDSYKWILSVIGLED
jgi:putative serine/threonine protein kinase